MRTCLKRTKRKTNQKVILAECSPIRDYLGLLFLSMNSFNHCCKESDSHGLSTTVAYKYTGFANLVSDLVSCP